MRSANPVSLVTEWRLQRGVVIAASLLAARGTVRRLQLNIVPVPYVFGGSSEMAWRGGTVLPREGWVLMQSKLCKNAALLLDLPAGWKKEVWRPPDVSCVRCFPNSVYDTTYNILIFLIV